ncbi:MAG: response regulator [Armatimonadetes bacterium]|nr:response regulator [Armatimonadota bacterium]
MKVLVADDEILVRYALKVILAEAGHQVTEAANGLQALQVLQDDPPDVLILDLSMPVMSGYEVLRWLEEHSPARALSIIVVSGFVAEADAFDRHPLVTAVHQKPLIIDQLLDSLRECEDERIFA